MKSIYAGLLLAFSLFFTGCAQGNNNMKYKIDDIEKIEFEISDGVLKLSYVPILESLYYSPGINYSINDDYVVIDIVRCNINDECEVLEKASQGDRNTVNMKIGIVSEPTKIFINEPKEKNSIANLSLSLR